MTTVKRYLAASLAALTLLSLCACGVRRSDDGETGGAGRSDVSQKPAQTDAPEPTDVRLTFACAGDNIVHESVYVQAAEEAAALASTGSAAGAYYFDAMYDDAVRELISGADVAFVNQEGPISGAKASGYPNFNAPEEAGDALVALGFDIVNLANNHMLDMEYVTTGYENTIAYWKKRDVLAVGGYESQADYDTIRYIEREGVKIAVLSYTYGTNGYSVNAASGAVVPLIDDARITSQIAEAKQNADLVFVSMHWGDENVQSVSAEQRRLATLIADAGADCVIGHHSHTVQPIEWVLGKGGARTLVIYSLGNFISSQLYSKNLVGQIVTFDIVKERATGSTRIENVKSNPVVTHYLSDTNVFDSLDLAKRYSIHIYMLRDYTAGQCTLHGAHVWDDFDLSKLRGYITSAISAEFLPDYLK